MSTTITHSTVTSKDGTVIAYSQIGQGPTLSWWMVRSVIGNLGLLRVWPQSFLPILPSSPMIVGGAAKVAIPGHTRSSGKSKICRSHRSDWWNSLCLRPILGSALAIEAANRLPGITKLALYEAPFVVNERANQ